MAENVAQRSNVLDFGFFDTNGYIPVFSTGDAAWEGLNMHHKKKISCFKLFKIQIQQGSNLYCRVDKYDKWKHEMFFPIALARDDDTDKALKDRWFKQYKGTFPYPDLWDWKTANFEKLKVKELPT